jgi:hypothetical protein
MARIRHIALATPNPSTLGHYRVTEVNQDFSLESVVGK